MKHKLILILVSATVILGASCSPLSPAPPPKIDATPRPDATAMVALTVKPTPVETATLARTTVAPIATPSRIVAPIAVTTPAQALTRLFTVVPITQTESTIGKDKTNMIGVPIPLPLDPSLEKMVTQAREDLAKRLAVNIDQISLVEVQSVTWPDGSLGCPQPGMAYIQVTVDGLLIRLTAGGNLYEYHSGGTRAPFLCKPNP